MVHKKSARSHRSSKPSRANKKRVKVDPLRRYERITRTQWSDDAVRRANRDNYED
jgi:hypothetical protein